MSNNVLFILDAIEHNLGEIISVSGDIVKCSFIGNGIYCHFENGDVYRIGLPSKDQPITDLSCPEWF